MQLPAYISATAAKEVFRALGVSENIDYSENGGIPIANSLIIKETS